MGISEAIVVHNSGGRREERSGVANGQGQVSGYRFGGGEGEQSDRVKWEDGRQQQGNRRYSRQ